MNESLYIAYIFLSTINDFHGNFVPRLPWDIDKVDDPVKRNATISFINNFGQTQKQVNYDVIMLGSVGDRGGRCVLIRNWTIDSQYIIIHSSWMISFQFPFINLFTHACTHTNPHSCSRSPIAHGGSSPPLLCMHQLWNHPLSHWPPWWAPRECSTRTLSSSCPPKNLSKVNLFLRLSIQITKQLPAWVPFFWSHSFPYL